MEILGLCELLGEQGRAHHCSRAFTTRLPLAWSGKSTWATPVIDQRVDDPVSTVSTITITKAIRVCWRMFVVARLSLTPNRRGARSRR